jgi:uncharacterized UPF0160 family protein
MKIVTHNGQFHTDDIFAIATLLLIYPEAEVVRSRDPEIIKAADIAVDVGQVYDPEAKRFDHHQAGGAGKRDNGIPFASFGLVWKEYGASLASDGVGIIDRKLAMYIDAGDNGVDLYEPKFEGVRPYTIGDLIYSYVDQENANEDYLYKTFIDSVKFAQELLLREIKNAQNQIGIRRVVLKTYAESQNKQIITFDNRIAWLYGADLMPETLYVVYLRKDDTWGVRALTPTNTTYKSKKPFPEAWRAKSNEDLVQITGVSDATFCHKEGFLAVAKSKEGALKLAQIALNA